MATKDDLTSEAGAIRTEMARRFDRVDRQLLELDAELTKHADVHAELEREVGALKRRPTRPTARPARRR